MREDVQTGPFVVPPSGLPAPNGEFVAPGFASFRFRIVTDDGTEHARFSIRHVGEFRDSTFEFSTGVRASRTDTQAPFTPGFAGSASPLPTNPFDRTGGDSVGALTTRLTAPRDWSEREREVDLSGTLLPDEALGVFTSNHDANGTSDRVDLAANRFFVRSAAVEIELTRERANAT